MCSRSESSTNLTAHRDIGFRQARIEPDDRLIVSFLGGNIVITPKKVVEEKSDIMSYAGMFTGTWGNTPEAVEATIRNLRDEWSNYAHS